MLSKGHTCGLLTPNSLPLPCTRLGGRGPSRPFRVLAGDKKDAGKQIKQTQEAVKSAVSAIEGHLATESSETAKALAALSTATSRLGVKEQELWDRQREVHQRDLERWSEERTAWAAREALLTQQVSELQGALVQLATHSIGRPGVAERATEAPASLRSTTLPASELAAGMSFPDGPEPLLDRPATPLAEPGQLAGGLGLGPTAQLDGPSAAMPAVPAAQQTGPPPKLVKGNDDIFWVHKLQSGLMNKGFSIDEDEMEDFMFGEATESALLTFQACSSLKENGVTSMETWRALWGDDLPSLGPAGTEEPSGSSEVSPLAASGLASDDPWGTAENGDAGRTQGTGAAAAGSPPTREPVAADTASSPDLPPRGLTEWPMLRVEDGGRDVHHLHVALQRRGYDCHNDDVQWWQYGDSTYSAVQVFQACNGLPQTGVVDDDTWQSLLGSAASPTDVDFLFSGDDSDTDMLANKGVWLLGEQRWSRAPGSY